MNGMDDFDHGFDPEQLEDLEQLMDEIMAEESVGYQMVFWISVGAAKELLASYDRYRQGSYQDAILIMVEFTKIIEQLREEVNRDEEND